MKYEFENIPQMFFTRAEQYASRVAFRSKKGGKWVDSTWTELKEKILAIASALIELGVKKGDKVNILSQTREEWVLVDIASLSVGAITVPIYPSNTAEQCEYIINDSESKVIFLENAAQLDKILSIRKNIPNVIKIIFF